jgi:tetratricopeptide (TPR) repeat protein
LLYFFLLGQDAVLRHVQSLDTTVYLQRASEIAAGDFLGSEPLFHSGFLYPYIIALLGNEPRAVILAQLVAGALTSAMLYGIGRFMHGHVVGIIAGVLHALCAVFLFDSGNLLFDSWVTVLVILAVAATHLATRRCRSKWWFLTGLSLGLAGTARPFLLLYFPMVLLVWFLATRGLSKRDLARATLSTTAGLIVVLAPISIRNGIIAGEFLPLPTTGGFVFYLGNNPLATGTLIIPEHLGVRNRADLYASSTLTYPARRLGRDVTYSEAGAFWVREGLGYWWSDPAGALALTGRKLAMLLNGAEFDDNYSFDMYRQRIWLLRWLPTAALLISLGLPGIVLAFRQWHHTAPALVMVGIYICVLPLLIVTARFRYPLLALFAVFAGLAIVEVVQAVRQGGRLYAAVGIAVFVAATLLVRYPFKVEGDTDSAVQLAEAYLTAGDSSSALAAANAGLARKPQAALYLAKGKALHAQGRESEALAALRQAIFKDPKVGDAHDLIGEIARTRASPEELALKRALAVTPAGAEAHLALAQFYYDRTRYNEAISHARRAVALEPGLSQALWLLALAYMQRGLPTESIHLYEHLLEKQPGDPDILANLAFAHFDAGHFDEAEAMFVRVQGVRPDHQLAHYGLGLIYKFSLRLDRARAEFERFLAAASPDSPWMNEARANLKEIERLAGK